MKKVLVFLSVTAASYTHAQVSSVKLASSPEPFEIVRSSVTVPEEQEQLFWSIYTEYTEQKTNEGECSSVNLNASAGNASFSAALAAHDVDPSVCIVEMLDNQARQLKTKSLYFDKIRKAVNGSVALQFLQSEALMELLQRSRMYEGLDWSHPQWSSGLIKDAKAKCDVFEFTLGFTPEEAETFRPMFQEYEFYYSRIVGHGMFFFEQYIDNTSFSTPGQCVKYGSDFVKMQENEIDLRKKFFTRMSTVFDSNRAARFLALDDYFTMMDKLKVWSDNVVTYAQK